MTMTKAQQKKEREAMIRLLQKVWKRNGSSTFEISEIADLATSDIYPAYEDIDESGKNKSLGRKFGRARGRTFNGFMLKQIGTGKPKSYKIFDMGGSSKLSVVPSQEETETETEQLPAPPQEMKIPEEHHMVRAIKVTLLERGYEKDETEDMVRRMLELGAALELTA